MPLSVIAYHGWGYDASVWQNWQGWFAGLGYGFEAADRGYFGSGRSPIWPPDCLILAHSYGLHLALKAWQQQDFPPLAGLVIFSSFQQFHPEAERSRLRSRQRVEQMIAQFQLHPAQVLQSFWAKSADSARWPAAPPCLNRNLLLQDLQDLNQAELDPTLLQTIAKTIPNLWVFQGGADRIVAPVQGRALAEQLAAPYLELPDAGHALPFTQAETCQAKLKALL